MIEPIHNAGGVRLYRGDARRLVTEPLGLVHAVVTDPPYELGLDGLSWDRSGVAFDARFWRRVLMRVAPGGWMLCFGAPRFLGRLQLALEDGGWQYEDTVMWIYGQGWPKGRTRLKPAHESIIVASRPSDDPLQRLEGELWKRLTAEEQAASSGRTATLESRSPAARCWNTVSWWRDCLGDLSHPESMSTTATGSGATIDPRTLRCLASRITLDSIIRDETDRPGSSWNASPAARALSGASTSIDAIRELSAAEDATGQLARRVDGSLAFDPAYEPVVLCRRKGPPSRELNVGERGVLGADGVLSGRDSRYPANVILDPEAAAELDRQSGFSRSRRGVMEHGPRPNDLYLENRTIPNIAGHDDEGGASRFFFVAKPSRSEKDMANRHVSVKPLDLMRHLVSLVSFPGETVLDPFLGSGTTAVACAELGRRCLGFEQDQRSLDVAVRRLRRGAIRGGRHEDDDGASAPGHGAPECVELPTSGREGAPGSA